VIAKAVRRSALADYTDRFATLSATSGGELSVRELPFVSQINLRANPNDAGLMQQLESALGFALPVVPNTAASREDRRALWLAPDEWLVVGLDGQQAAFEQILIGGSIVDVSANRTLLEIRGPKARELLAHGVSIDLDARAFGPGRCAQTLLAKTQVIIERIRDDPAFRIYVRSSYASYAAEWLLDAAAE